MGLASVLGTCVTGLNKPASRKLPFLLPTPLLLHSQDLSTKGCAGEVGVAFSLTQGKKSRQGGMGTMPVLLSTWESHNILSLDLCFCKMGTIMWPCLGPCGTG